MKSPTLQTVIIAVVFAIIAYIVTFVVPTSPILIAALVFVSALLAPLVSGSSSTSQDSASSNNSDVADEDVRTLYVGNLPYRANETAVRELFSDHGSVLSVRLMKDKHTGKRRGFGFVEMAAADLDKAITALNDTEFQQRTLKVREAKDRPERADDNNQDD
ncbi:RNA recognition motif domain-containing protein [Colwellia psychrerythraea]|uniref:RNP-1 like RNA-binding protein n=1 Tax=Colwellia psychrerythraea TaxID=28229 RepID=A0A099L4C5_COLPS|nr:RNA-binding protein [Colwellia psychrerythraea]KGJ97300.1 RNP-1 like RNA-binding protein [Colwellia psychrerythraea]